MKSLSMQAELNQAVLNVIHLFNAKFSGHLNSKDGDLFKLAAFQAKMTLGVGAHENGLISTNGTYRTSIHKDQGRAEYPKVDSAGTLHNLGKMDGVRLIFGMCKSTSYRQTSNNSTLHTTKTPTKNTNK